MFGWLVFLLLSKSIKFIRRLKHNFFAFSVYYYLLRAQNWAQAAFPLSSALSISLSALTLAPGCLHVVSPTSPLRSILSDHLCQRDERVKDSSDTIVSFDTHFHSSEPRLKYTSESHFYFSAPNATSDFLPAALMSYSYISGLGFFRAPEVLLFPQPHLQPGFQRSSASPISSAKMRPFS